MKLRFCCIAFFFLFLSSAVARQGQRYALTGVSLFDTKKRVLAPRQTVVITDGLIADVFADGSKRLPDSIRVMPMNGQFLLPGLIDTHVHLATDPSGTDKRSQTLDVLRRMLLSGITSVRDMAGDARVLAGLSRDALVGDMVSPNIYYSALMAGPAFFEDPRTIVSTRGGMSGSMPYMRAVTDSTDLVRAVAEARGTGATGIKLYAALDAVVVARIVAEAKRQGILVWGHAMLRPARPHDLVQAGVSSLSHAPLLVYEGVDTVPAAWKKKGPADKFFRDSLPDLKGLFAQMVDQQTILDATMLTYQQWAQQDSTMPYFYAITKAYTAAAHKAGVKICAGTDDDQHHFVQSELELLVKDAGFTPAEAIVAATQYGADALGIGNMTGSIDIGKKADLIVLNKNPLEQIGNIRSVTLVIKGGRIYKPVK